MSDSDLYKGLFTSSCSVGDFLSDFLKICLFLPPQTKLREVYVFIGVCLSTGVGGEVGMGTHPSSPLNT